MTSSTKATEVPRDRRKRAAALREEARRAGLRRRRRRTVAVVAALVVAVGGGIAVQAARTTSGEPSGAPRGVTADGFGFAVGPASAPVTVDVYEDFLCPACARFEESASGALRQMADDGTVRVVYRPMAFLDGASTNRYSTRALNAAACAADSGAGGGAGAAGGGASGFAVMHDALYGVQPAEGGPGLSDAELVELGGTVGVTGEDFGTCVTSLRHERFTQAATEAASKARVVQTPTVLVNGTPLVNPTVDALRSAVTEATG